jgi:hypothetical protein
LYSASDVARLSGAPLRSVRYWALTRVLEAEPESDRAGMGHHRKFGKVEAIIACIVQYFSSRDLQVGYLTVISKRLRAALLGDEWALDCLRGAIRNDFKVFMVVPDQGLEHGWISLYSESTEIHNGKLSGMPIIANVDGASKVVMVIRPAIYQEVAGMFGRMTIGNPGFHVVLLNGCFSHLRPEWLEHR